MRARPLRRSAKPAQTSKAKSRTGIFIAVIVFLFVVIGGLIFGLVELISLSNNGHEMPVSSATAELVTITIVPVPATANVAIGHNRSKGPMRIKRKRGDNVTVRVTLKGYIPYEEAFEVTEPGQRRIDLAKR